MHLRKPMVVLIGWPISVISHFYDSSLFDSRYVKTVRKSAKIRERYNQIAP